MATVTQVFPAASGDVRTSGFPQLVKANGTSIPIMGYAFDATAEEALFFDLRAADYDSGDLTVDVDWYADTASSGAVVWGCQIAALTPNTDTQDVETDGLATANTVTTTHPGGTVQRPLRSSITVTNLDSLADGDDVRIRIYRAAAAAGDTMTGDAILTQVTVSYTATGGGGGGGTGDGIPESTVTAKGDLLVATGSAAIARLPVGSAGQVLTADAAQATGVKWATPAAGGSGWDGLPSTVYVVAADAPAGEAARGDYVCDGAADDVQILAAIADVQAMSGGVPTRSGRVLLSQGTFVLSNRIVIDGGGDVNVEHNVMLQGAGESATVIDATAGSLVSGIHLTGSCKVHLSDFRVLVDGATHGISSAGELTAAAVYRSFWQSSFRNLTIAGDWEAHTGYGFHLGSPFRSVFENIEVGGCGNGFRLFSESDNFNPGDCTFQRIFCDIVGNGHRAFSIESTKVDGNMNQIEFSMCEAITDGTGCTGIYLGGSGATPGPVNHCKFHGINLEQFDTCFEVNNGEGNQIDGNYWELGPGSGLTLIKFGDNAINNWVRAVGMWYSAAAQVLITSTASDTDMPNLVEHVKILNDGGAITNDIDTAGAVIRKWTVADTGPISGVTVTPA